MTRDVGHVCGHVVEWSAETESEVAFGFFCAELAAFPCPFCGGEAGVPQPSYIREVRLGRAPFPETVARRKPPA
jgi:hypothetical protein